MGVQVEQLWATLKAPAKVARYMSTPNWYDFYESVFAGINADKARGFVSYMQQQQANINKLFSASLV